MEEIHWSVRISVLIAVIVTVLTRHMRPSASDKHRLRQAHPRGSKIVHGIELGFRMVAVGMAVWFVLHLIGTEFWSEAKKNQNPALWTDARDGSVNAAKKFILERGNTMDVSSSLFDLAKLTSTSCQTNERT